MSEFSWTRIQCQPESGEAYCLNGVGVVLSRNPHSGTWYYYLYGYHRRMPETVRLEDALETVERDVMDNRGKT